MSEGQAGGHPGGHVAYYYKYLPLPLEHERPYRYLARFPDLLPQERPERKHKGVRFAERDWAMLVAFVREGVTFAEIAARHEVRPARVPEILQRQATLILHRIYWEQEQLFAERRLARIPAEALASPHHYLRAHLHLLPEQRPEEQGEENGGYYQQQRDWLMLRRFCTREKTIAELERTYSLRRGMLVKILKWEAYRCLLVAFP